MMANAKELEWWRPRLEAWTERNRPGYSPAEARFAAEAYAELLRISRRFASRTGSAAANLIAREGDSRWEAQVDRKIFGDQDSARSLKSLLTEMAERAATGELEHPTAFATRAFENLATSLFRAKRDRLEGRDDEEGGGVEPWDFLDRDDYVSQATYGTESPGVRATALPMSVAQALRTAARLAPVYALAVEGARAVDARPWAETAGCVERDVALDTARLRWGDGAGGTIDQHARSWQARYHHEEGHVDHTDDGEVPASGASARAKFDQHASRFRKLWRAAVGTSDTAIANHGGQVLAGVGRVPLRIDPPRHMTLGDRPDASHKGGPR